MPDLAPGYTGSARQSGSYGSGPNGTQYANLSSIQYVNPAAFTSPISVSTAPGCTAGGRNEATACNAAYLIGSAPRTAPYTLRAPGTQDIDGRLSRTFPLHFENAAFVFEADCLNLWNKNTFGSPSASWSNGSTSFGQISSASGARDWQFAGHINF
jgi:hypothetical protein